MPRNSIAALDRMVYTCLSTGRPRRLGQGTTRPADRDEETFVDRKWWTLVAVCCGTFMLLLDITVVNVALPNIQLALHSTFADLQWVVDAYALTLAAFLLTAGVLGDMYGRRGMFAIGLVLFSLASLACGIATTPLVLNLARGAQGVGGAIMFATSLALIAQAFAGKERGTAIGIYGAVVGGAVAIGPLVGGAITSGIGWRWIFFLNIPIGAVALVITLTKVDNAKIPSGRHIDWLGFITFSASLFMLVFALVQGNAKGWGSHYIMSLLIGSAVLMVVFLVGELLLKDPMLDLALFKRPAMVGVSLGSFTLSASIFAMFLYLTLYMQEILGYSALQAGLRFLPLTLLAFIAAPIADSPEPLFDGSRPGSGGHRLPAHDSRLGHLVVARPVARLPGVRRRHWDHQPGAGIRIGFGGAARAQRNVDGCSQHVPPGGDRHRHRRTRRHLRPPDEAGGDPEPSGHGQRPGDHGPRRSRARLSIGFRWRAPGGGIDSVARRTPGAAVGI